jgi:hypothetical protein
MGMGMSSGKFGRNWGRTAGTCVLAAGTLMGVERAACAQTAQTSVEPPAATPEPIGQTAPAPALAAPAVTLDEAQPEPAHKKKRQFGAMLDLGVPDGVMASFVYRPLKLARFHGGLGYNGISPGFRLGGDFLPLGWGPSLGLAYGHYFDGDANGLVGTFAGSAPDGAGSLLLKSVGYDYVNLRVGMEFGGDRFTFFIRGGLCWMHATIHHLDSLLDKQDSSVSANTKITIKQDPILNVFAPTIQLGFIVQL